MNDGAPAVTYDRELPTGGIEVPFWWVLFIRTLLGLD